MYEKIIEILSADNDFKFEEYLGKLKSMHIEEEKFEHSDFENSSKQIFQMSKSYKDEGEQSI